MALNLKAALGICLFFIAGLCYVVNRVALPSQAAASQLTGITDGSGQVSRPSTFSARRLARQSPVEAQRVAMREAAAQAAAETLPETRTVPLPPVARHPEPANPPALLAAESGPELQARGAGTEQHATGTPVASRINVIEEQDPSAWETAPAHGKLATLTAVEQPSAAPAPEPVSAERAAAPAVASTYKVQKGDSLIRVARQLFGSSDQRYVRMLIEANPKIAKRTNKLFVGEELTVPVEAAPQNPTYASAPRARSAPAPQPVAPPASDAVAVKTSKAGRKAEPAADKQAGTAVAKAKRSAKAAADTAKKSPKSGKKGGKGDPSTATGGEQWYTIRGSDSLASIARDVLKDGRRWRELADVNGLRDPNKIIPGTRIKLPAGANRQG